MFIGSGLPFRVFSPAISYGFHPLPAPPPRAIVILPHHYFPLFSEHSGLSSGQQPILKLAVLSQELCAVPQSSLPPVFSPLLQIESIFQTTSNSRFCFKEIFLWLQLPFIATIPSVFVILTYSPFSEYISFSFLIFPGSPGCPGTCPIDQFGIKLRDLPASVSLLVALKLTAVATPLKAWTEEFPAVMSRDCCFRYHFQAFLVNLIWPISLTLKTYHPSTSMVQGSSKLSPLPLLTAYPWVLVLYYLIYFPLFIPFSLPFFFLTIQESNPEPSICEAGVLAPSLPTLPRFKCCVPRFCLCSLLSPHWCLSLLLCSHSVNTTHTQTILTSVSSKVRLWSQPAF